MFGGKGNGLLPEAADHACEYLVYIVASRACAALQEQHKSLFCVILPVRTAACKPNNICFKTSATVQIGSS